jgi:hypothetical protein
VCSSAASSAPQSHLAPQPRLPRHRGAVAVGVVEVRHRREVGLCTCGVGHGTARASSAPRPVAAAGRADELLGCSGAGVICRGSLAQLLELPELQVTQHHRVLAQRGVRAAPCRAARTPRRRAARQLQHTQLHAPPLAARRAHLPELSRGDHCGVAAAVGLRSAAAPHIRIGVCSGVPLIGRIVPARAAVGWQRRRQEAHGREAGACR